MSAGTFASTHARIASIIVQTIHRLLEVVGIRVLEKLSKMFVEPDGLVIVTVQQSLLMQLRLVD